MTSLMIYHSKESSIEFTVDITGVDTKDMSVRFVIEADKMDLSFVCSSDDKKTWKCSVPPLKFIEKTTYPYRIEVFAEGYYFKGSTGTVTIATSAELYVSDIKPLKPTKPSESKKDEKEDKKENVKEDKKDNNTNEKNDKNNEKNESLEISALPCDSVNDIIQSTHVEKDVLIKNILKEAIGDKPKTQPKPLFTRKLK